MLTTIENANDCVQVDIREVQPPHAIASYNQYMNVVDCSDQILVTNNVLHKCMRWWKTLFFHLIDFAALESFLFKEHQAEFPDVQAHLRTSGYSLAYFREEIIRGT